MKTTKTICACLALWLIALSQNPVAANEISVTVYNGDLGVVREVRTLKFNKGKGRLSFRDVPSRIDATSVGFTALDRPGQIQLLEQNYQFDLVSPEKLYQRYIDRTIELFANDGKIYSGTLMAFASNTITLLDRNGRIQIIRLDEIANVSLPELPEGLITRPTLFWDYTSQVAGEFPCEVSYQTSGMSWSAEYVATLNEREDKLRWTGWSSITNHSGKTYNDAKLKLVAGDINRAGQEIYPAQPRYAKMAAENMAAGFVEKAFFEYHLYTLPRPSTIANNEIKQLSLFEPATAGVEKEYHFNSTGSNRQVDVKLKFKNSEANGLGMPLPAGRVRVFKNDSDGSAILLGEDRIKHTPKDEELLLTIGKAFDIVAEETTTDRRALSQSVTEFDYKVEIRNHKDEPITVLITRNLGADWEILKTSHPAEKLSADRVRFAVAADANANATLTYTVRYTRQ